MRLGREMQDDVGAANKSVDDIGVEHIAVPEFETLVVETVLGQVGDARGIGQRIEDDDLVAGIFLINVADEIAADEAGAASDQKRRHAFPFKTEMLLDPALSTKSSAER